MTNFEYIQNNLPKAEILAQLAEEAAELAQAALKLRRALDGVNPTPVSVDEAFNNLIEEMADVDLCYTLYVNRPQPDARYFDSVYKLARFVDEKSQRRADRLEALKNENRTD